MAKKLKPLSSAQEEIMEIIWKRGEVAVSDVVDIISKRRTTSRTTVQTLLVRMKEKGWVKTRQVGQAFVYRATRKRSTTVVQKAKNLLNDYFEGSAKKLLNALLEGDSLSSEEADELRELIDRAESNEQLAPGSKMEKTQRKSKPKKK